MKAWHWVLIIVFGLAIVAYFVYDDWKKKEKMKPVRAGKEEKRILNQDQKSDNGVLHNNETQDEQGSTVAQIRSENSEAGGEGKPGQ